MKESQSGQTRRSVLAGVAGTGTAAVLSGLIPDSATANKESDITDLGTFESGTDGWRTNGGNELERIEMRERPPAIVEGSHGLKVVVNGDAQPVIENGKRVKTANFVDYPYLVASATPSVVSDTDSAVTFTFRLHHSAGATNADKSNRGGNDPDGKKTANVESSDSITIRPMTRNLLTWDLSGIEDAKLKAAKRLEIVWHPAEYTPSGNHRGRNRGFDYRGDVVFDDIHLSDSRTDLAGARMADDFRDLQFEHGQYRETEITSRTSESEAGRFAFDSGATVEYAYETVADGKYRITMGESTYRFGEGWE